MTWWLTVSKGIFGYIISKTTAKFFSLCRRAARCFRKNKTVGETTNFVPSRPSAPVLFLPQCLMTEWEWSHFLFCPDGVLESRKGVRKLNANNFRIERKWSISYYYFLNFEVNRLRKQVHDGIMSLDRLDSGFQRRGEASAVLKNPITVLLLLKISINFNHFNTYIILM